MRNKTITPAQQKPVKAAIGGTIAPKIALAPQKPVKTAIGGTIAPRLVAPSKRS